jgi:hypothetical protein
MYAYLYWPRLDKAADGFVVGAITGFILVLIHSYYVKRVTREVSEKSFNVRQQHTVLLHVPYDQAFDLCKESLSVVGRSKIREENRDAGFLQAKTKITFKYLCGDVISYEINKIGDRLMQIEISSKPHWPGVMVDNGKNLENVEKISQFLTEKDDHLDIRALSTMLDIPVESEVSKRRNEVFGNQRHNV